MRQEAVAAHKQTNRQAPPWRLPCLPGGSIGGRWESEAEGWRVGGMGWDGMGWDGMGWDGKGRDGTDGVGREGGEGEGSKRCRSARAHKRHEVGASAEHADERAERATDRAERADLRSAVSVGSCERPAPPGHAALPATLLHRAWSAQRLAAIGMACTSAFAK